jgi:uncharacterized protein (DUF2141 family)
MREYSMVCDRKINHPKTCMLLFLFCLLVPEAHAQEKAAPQPNSGFLGPDAAFCTPRTAGLEGDNAAPPAIAVTVVGFKERSGQVRLELFPATNEDFLARRQDLQAAGKTFKRIDVPTPTTGPVTICMQLPAAGRYALAVLHDRNKNNRLEIFRDGFGFPGNPRLGYSKPDVSKVSFTTQGALTPLEIRLNYWNGIAARPISAAKER